jgi:FlaA1/EpsC-like NDP-sugar epimerase
MRQLAPLNKIFGIDSNETGIFDLMEEHQLKGQWVYGRVGDVRDTKTLEDVFSDFKPEIVIHAAALKHVKPNEDYPLEAIQTNVIGTYNVIFYAKKYLVKKFIFISTDKVVNANSIMGATKKLGEIMARNQGYTAVRFGNVMGSRGSVLPFWENQINKGDPITVTDERMERYFMSIPDAVKLVIQAMEMGRGGETIILSMGKPVKIIDLAHKLIRELKSDTKIKMIGIRPGETLGERLMSEEEKKIAKKKGKFYII